MNIKVNNTTLFFDIYGSSLKILPDKVVQKPTLIVLHGGHGFADHTLYVDFWSQFSDVAQVIFLDQRGCGRSDASTPEFWNLQTWAEDVYQFCQALSIDKPILAGVSMGGHVMCEYVKQHPEHLGGLIFCNTEARFVIEDICQVFRQHGAEVAADACYAQYRRPTEQSLQNYLSKCVPHFGHNPYSVEEVARCLGQPEVFQHYCREQVNTFDYLDILTTIQCPTLLLVGEDSPLHPPIRAIEMAERIPAHLVDLQIIKHAGAAVYNDQLEVSEQLVRSFLEQMIVEDSNDRTK